MPVVAAAACVFCLLVLLRAILAKDRRTAGIAKTGASLAFVAFGWACGVLDAGPAGIAVFAGLVLGAIGDVALIGKDKRAFLFGIATFLLGHVAYVVAFRAWGASPLSVIGASLVLVGPAFYVLRWVGDANGMRPAVIAYMVVITSMVAMAVGSAVLAGSDDASWRFGLLGSAILFYASDLFVARERFVVSEPRNRLVGLPLYYVAQLGFAWFAAMSGPTS